MADMTTQRIPLEGERAITFRDAFDKRSDYIRAERIHHLIGGEDSVPLPGCPNCNAPSENVAWHIYDEWIDLDVDPCGHRFKIERPVEPQRSSDGWFSSDGWLP